MLAGVLGSLLNCAELALLGEVASLLKTLLLLGSAVLRARNNATVLVHHDVRLGETSVGLVCSAVPNLCAGPLEKIELLAMNVVGTILVLLNPLNHF